jgi:cephalosporin-C deacetylase-like acetyl esterase
VTRPADFDAFWSEIMDAARAIPLNPTLTHIPLRSTPELDV